MALSVLTLWCLLAAGAEPVRLTVADEGKTIQTKVGGVMLLALPSNAGTGYLWLRESPDSETVSVREDPADTKAAKPGAPKEQVFRLTARSAGRASLKFVLRRPWEKSAKPAGAFQVTLVIQR